MPPVDARTSLLFVYGTLRSGEGSHHLLIELGAEFVGRGRVRGELFDLGPFPGAVKCAADSEAQVTGEVYRLRDLASSLRALDDYENAASGPPNLYRREVAVAALSDGTEVAAWMYWLIQQPAEPRLIHSGNYASRRSR